MREDRIRIDGWHPSKLDVCRVTAPFISTGGGCEPCLNGVEMDVFADIDLIKRGFDQLCEVSILEYVTDVVVFAVKVVGISVVDLFHNELNVRVVGLDLEVDMIRHQAVGVKIEGEFHAGFTQIVQVDAAVLRIVE